MMNWFPDKNLYVTPTPHDGGLTLGAAQLVWHQKLDNPRIIWEDNYTPYLGADHTNLIEPTIEKFKDTVISKQATDDEVVNLPADQKIVAVFGGGSESGRRALGNRSILFNCSDKVLVIIKQLIFIKYIYGC